MTKSYQDREAALNYIEFLESEDGRIQQAVLSEAIFRHLPQNAEQQVLDAACGSGWLTKMLANRFPKTVGCDNSQELLAHAKKSYPGITFTLADLTAPLPYSLEQFDAVVLNMAGPDIADLGNAFKNLFANVKETGQLLVTIPNPYYTYPVGVWKRSLFDAVFGRKPKLRIQNAYNVQTNIAREFNNGKDKIHSNFYPLSEYISSARSAGYKLITLEELRSAEDSERFNLKYKLFRYPLLLLLEFVKPPER